MKTEIYSDYEAFLAREDKTLNGVTADFAERNEGCDKERNSEGCWNCSDCSDCSGCSDCSRCSRCSDCSGCSDCSRCSLCSLCSDCSRCSRCSRCSLCSDCSGCSVCSRCSRCSRCSDCSGCSDCSRCSRCSHIARLAGRENLNPIGSPSEPNKSWFQVPVIPNIHQAVLEAVKKPGALDMSTWHSCNTTHCRGGWVVTLAGEEGRKLEANSTTLFAAQQIYKASSNIRVSPVRFFEKNAVAMADMERCAKEEANA